MEHLMEHLEDVIKCAAMTLPPHWVIRLDVENGCADVKAIRPDGCVVSISDNDWCLAEVVRHAISFTHDEDAADKQRQEGG